MNKWFTNFYGESILKKRLAYNYSIREESMFKDYLNHAQQHETPSSPHLIWPKKRHEYQHSDYSRINVIAPEHFGHSKSLYE